MGDGASGRIDAKGKGRATPNNGMLALDLEHAEGGSGVPNGGSGAFQQMQLVEQQVHLSLFPHTSSDLGHSDMSVMVHAGQLHSITIHSH
jgi:hypothetical protein